MSNGGNVATVVNPQIIDAVTKTRSFVRGPNGAEDPGISYQKVSQATAFAIQDATDYLRNVMTMSATAQGMALKLFLETKDPLYEQVLQSAQTAVDKASQNLEAVGKAAVAIVTTYPPVGK